MAVIGRHHHLTWQHQILFSLYEYNPHHVLSVCREYPLSENVAANSTLNY